MTYSTFGQIVWWLFVIVFSLITILLIIITVQGYRSASQSKAFKIIKIIITFVVWLIISLYTLVTNALAFWAASHSAEVLFVKPDSSTISIIVTNLLWTFIGCGLLYWLSRHPQGENVAIAQANNEMNPLA